jgi:hypothetical protein
MAARVALPARVDQAEKAILSAVADAASLCAVISALESWTGPEMDSPIIMGFPPLFDDFHTKHFNIP